jgi:hypothetical protein
LRNRIVRGRLRPLRARLNLLPPIFRH